MSSHSDHVSFSDSGLRSNGYYVEVPNNGTVTVLIEQTRYQQEGTLSRKFEVYLNGNLYNRETPLSLLPSGSGPLPIVLSSSAMIGLGATASPQYTLQAIYNDKGVLLGHQKIYNKNYWVQYNYTIKAIYGDATGVQIPVVFNSNGGSDCGTKFYTVGNTYGSLPEPTKSDHSIFDGWYSDVALTKRVYTSTKVSTSVTMLYAKWISADKVKSISIEGSSILYPGGETNYVCMAKLDTGETKEAKATWSIDSAPSGRVSINATTGKLVSERYSDITSPITVRIKASFTTSITATKTITIPVAPKSISIYGDDDIAKGGQGQYTCKATMRDGTTKWVTPAWSVSAGWSSASITADGVLKVNQSISYSSVTIKAVYREGQYSCETTKIVTVNNSVVEQKVTVSFNSNGGSSCSSRQYTVNSTYGTLPEPTKSGCTFGGWYSDSALTKRVNSSTTVSSSVTKLYAKWIETPSSFSVKLAKNDGTSATKSYTMSAGSWTIPSASSLSWSRSGYDFLGWSTSSAATTAKYSDGQAITISGDTTLYAVWKAKPKYEVKLYKNDGTSTTESYTQVAGSWTIPSISSLLWSRKGYVFSGWNTSRTATSHLYFDGQIINVSSALSLYAVWVAIPEVTLPTPVIQSIGAASSSYGGDVDLIKLQWSPVESATGYVVYRSTSSTGGGAREQIKPTIGTINTYSTINGQMAYTKIYFAEDKTVVPGVDYSYWVVATNASGKSEYSSFRSAFCSATIEVANANLKINDSGRASSNITVKANTTWGAVSSDTSWLTVKVSGSTLTVNVAANSKTTERKGTITVTAAAKTPHPVSRTVSVVQPGIILPKCKVTFDANGGSGGSECTVVMNSAVGTLPIPALNGYLFLGWFTEKNGGTKITEMTKVTKDATYCAHWQYVGTADDSKIVFELNNSYIVEDDGAFPMDFSRLVGSTSVPKLTVQGLPVGLKYDSKSMTITGKATNPGSYAVTVRATNATVKEPAVATFTLKVPNLSCDALPKLEQETNAYGVVRCGVAFNSGLVNCSSKDGWTVKVSGLPAGLKYDAKAGVILGVTTAKAGAYTVTFTASKRGEKNQIATITLNVETLPDWAMGTFTGLVSLGASANPALATMTVAASGKISGKMSICGTNWTFSTASYAVGGVRGEILHREAYMTDVIAKAGKAMMPIHIEVCAADAPSGATTLVNGMAYIGFGDHSNLFGEGILPRNMWKDKATASAAKNLLSQWEGVYAVALSCDGAGVGYLSLIVGKDGNVKSAGKLADGTSVSSASPLVCFLEDDEVWNTVVYAAPTAYKGGVFCTMPVFSGPHGRISSPFIGCARWTSLNPCATRVYGEGFNREVSLFGAYHDKSKKLVDYGNPLHFSIEVPELNGMLAQTGDPVAILADANGRIIVDKTSGLSISFTPATGVFKGSYTFIFDGKTKKRVNFEGIVASGAETFGGFYLWDALGSYDDPKTHKPKTYKYKESHSVILSAP